MRTGEELSKLILDNPLDFKFLTNNCMVDLARYFLDQTVEKYSCGKCVPCREGTKRILEILERITQGKGTPEDIETLEFLSEVITTTSLCKIGKTAAEPVIFTLKHFRDEYEAHIYDKKCLAGSCYDSLEYFITDKCIGCTKCAINCPVSCISGSVKKIHSIDTEKCIKCGECIEMCPVNAITR